MRLPFVFRSIAVLGLIVAGCSGGHEYNNGNDPAQDEAAIKQSGRQPVPRAGKKVNKPPAAAPTQRPNAAPIAD